MSKTMIWLILGAAPLFAQKQTDPETDTKKTAEQKGYHITHPKNTGATPESAKDKDKDKTDKDNDKKRRDGLQTQEPPTYQPNLAPPAGV